MDLNDDIEQIIKLKLINNIRLDNAKFSSPGLFNLITYLNFNVYILNSLCNSLCIELDPSYIDRCVDTLSLAKAIHLNLEYNNNTSLIEWQYKLCNLHKRGLKVSMQKLLEKYDIYHTEGMLHNAVYDINMNFKIFRKQLWEIEV